MLLSRRLLAVAPIAMALSGCVYIGNGPYNDKLAQIDEDGDGSMFVADNAADADCDDTDPTRSTLIIEDKCAEFLGRPVEPTDTDVDENGQADCVALAYNGNDDDCDKHDWVDIDGDGVPSMTLDEYTAANPDATWPDDRITPVTDATLVDCDDFAALVKPGGADAFYDGVDGDCSGNNDFDQDGDGYMPTTLSDGTEVAPLFEAYLAKYGYDLPANYGDCNDQEGDSFPGNSPDAWYDGFDTDCAGNNDFDQDGDGFMPDETPDGDGTEGLFAKYVENYDYDELPEAYGDCLDADPPATPTPPADIDPALVFPGADDDWYDGIDADCAGNNDFDQDNDAYVADGREGDVPAYEAFWGYSFDDESGDCDDTRFDVHPGEFELVGDTVDQDCDDEVDGSPFDTGGLGWDDPHSIYVGKAGDFYAISTTAEFLDYLTATKTRAGVTLYFDQADVLANPEPHPAADVPTPWWPSTSSLGTGIPPIGSGFASAYDADSLYLAISADQETATPEKGYFVVRRATTSGGSVSYQTAQSAGSTTVTEPYNDMDLKEDADGYLWAWGCGNDTAGFMASIDDPTASSVKIIRKGGTDTAGTGLNADTAVVVPGASGSNSATGWCCASGTCKSFSLTQSPASGTTVGGEATITANGTASQKYLAENSHNDAMAIVQSPQPGVIIIDEDGTSHTVLKTRTVTDAAVAIDGSTYFIVASTGSSDLVFAYGSITSLTETTIPFTDGTTSFTAKHVGIYADSDRIILAATAADGALLTSGTTGAADSDDHVGWVFLGR